MTCDRILGSGWGFCGAACQRLTVVVIASVNTYGAMRSTLTKEQTQADGTPSPARPRLASMITPSCTFFFLVVDFVRG